jgi:uroporphyrin-III C-methyltransferase
VSTSAEPGVVYLVGAGPGDPELLTLRAVRLLQTADVILPDDLVSDDVLSIASPSALVVPVGKRCGQPRITQAGIHALMLDHAGAGRSVLRLKSGDPLVFGRAGEEIDAGLRDRTPRGRQARTHPEMGGRLSARRHADHLYARTQISLAGS